MSPLVPLLLYPYCIWVSRVPCTFRELRAPRVCNSMLSASFVQDRARICVSVFVCVNFYICGNGCCDRHLLYAAYCMSCRSWCNPHDHPSKYYLPSMEYSDFCSFCGKSDFYYSYLLCVCSNKRVSWCGMQHEILLIYIFYIDISSKICFSVQIQRSPHFWNCMYILWYYTIYIYVVCQ